jgi:hypothetical protein
MKLIVYADQISQRLKYTFQEMVRYTPIVTVVFRQPEAYLPHDLADCFFWYSARPGPSPDIISARPSGILTDGAAVMKPEDVMLSDNLPWFYKTDGSGESTWQYDIPGMVFYLLSRAEEYGAELDQYGRFASRQSLAGQENFLEIPVVDMWKSLFVKTLIPDWLGRLQHQQPDSLTVDIDMAFAWKYKPVHLKGWGLLKAAYQRHWKTAGQMVEVWLGRKKDPYDTFDQFFALSKEAGVNLIFFVLSGKKTRLDRNLPPSHPAMHAIFSKISNYAQVGLHPSSLSGRDIKILEEEKKELEKAINQPVAISRQHYLILSFPATFRALLQVGIKEDHSMLYHDYPGFRAGTALPFKWYDLEAEKICDFTIVPYVAMDVTLKKYLQLSIQKASAALKTRKDALSKLGLPFRIIWHNSSLDGAPGWDGWSQVLKEAVMNQENKYNHEKEH